MKKKYEELEAEVIRFETQDVIITSGSTETPVIPASASPTQIF